jgi:Carboxypeptidase regulatory-like domain
MKKLIAVLSMATALIATAAASAPCGDVVGEILDSLGQPISGTQISVASSSGATVGRTVTGSDGAYAFRGLQPGAYTINSNGKSVVTYVGNDGMKVNWGVRPGAEPVVVAEPGATGVPVHSSATTTTTITDSPMQATAAQAKPDSHRCRGDDDDKNGEGDGDDRRCPPSGME